jgi:hypothetical protein
MPKSFASKFRIVTAQDKDFSSLWQRGIETFSDTSPFYTPEVRAYDRLYLGSAFLQDDSCVFIDGQGKITALLPLLLTNHNNIREYSMQGSWQWGPLFGDDATESKRTEVLRVLGEYIHAQAKERGVIAHRVKPSCPTILRGKIAYNIFRELGYKEENQTGLVLRLGKEENVLWSGVRDSYRPLINRATR